MSRRWGADSRGLLGEGETKRRLCRACGGGKRYGVVGVEGRVAEHVDVRLEYSVEVLARR